MRLLDIYRRMYSSCNAGKSLTPQEEITYLYGILGILDGKSSALMRFDAIMIAAASILLQAGGRGGVGPPPFAKTLAAILVCSLAAAGLCLAVVHIAYPFLGMVKIDQTSIDCTPEINALNNAAERRTRCYRLAWLLSVVAVLLFISVGIRYALR